MKSLEEKLKSIAEEIRQGVTPKPITVREFIGWIGAYKRGSNVNSRLRNALEKAELDTTPDFEWYFIDGKIKVVSSKETDDVYNSTPAHRIDSLSSANRKPLSVNPDSNVSEAITLMLTNDFSQLPVMTTEKEVKGIITWKALGSRLALGKKCTLVRECMDPAQITKSDESLFEAIEIITKYDYVLVQSPDKRITGIVTVSDLSFQFRDLAEPFLLIGEIERNVRRLIHGKFTAEDLSFVKHPGETQRAINGVADLTLGEYIRLLETPDNWKKLHLAVDRAEFVKRLNKVREIRNDVMHFDPQGIEESSLEELQLFVSFLGELRRCGVL